MCAKIARWSMYRCIPRASAAPPHGRESSRNRRLSILRMTQCIDEDVEVGAVHDTVVVVVAAFPAVELAGGADLECGVVVAEINRAVEVVVAVLRVADEDGVGVDRLAHEVGDPEVAGGDITQGVLLGGVGRCGGGVEAD